MTQFFYFFILGTPIIGIFLGLVILYFPTTKGGKNYP